MAIYLSERRREGAACPRHVADEKSLRRGSGTAKSSGAELGTWKRPQVALVCGRVANAQIVRRDGRRHVVEPSFGTGARDCLCPVHGGGLGDGCVSAGLSNSESFSTAAGRRCAHGGVYSDFQGAGEKAWG